MPWITYILERSFLDPVHLPIWNMEALYLDSSSIQKETQWHNCNYSNNDWGVSHCKYFTGQQTVIKSEGQITASGSMKVSTYS